MSLIHNSRKALAFLLMIGALALIALSFACGGGDDGGPTAATSPAATSPAASASHPGGEPQEFDVTMTDNKYDPTEFTASAGATLTFNLTNKGTALHNMRIAGEDNTYNNADDAVSDPDLITGGQTGTLTWTAPNEAGEYKFQCDIHPTDMLGTITVQ